MTAASSARRERRRVDPPSQRLAKTWFVISLFLIARAAFAASPDAIALVSTVIHGSTVYDAPQLYDIYRERLGKPIDEEGVRAIATALGDLYAADGYARPQLRMDSALVAAGVLRIEVLETRIAAVDLTGHPGPHRARLERLGGALRGAGPVRQDELQRTLQRMRELPGLTLTAATEREDAGPNVYRLMLDATYRPLSGSVRLSNRGTDQIGPLFLVGEVAANGLLGGNGSVGAHFAAAAGDYDEYRGAGAFVRDTFGDGGPRLAAAAFRSRSDPRETGVDRDLLYVRDRATLRVTLPAAERTWSPFFGTRAEDLEIVHQGERLRDERLRVVEGGIAFSARRANGVQMAASVELAKGLDAFGAGLRADDLAVDARRADFAVARFTYARLQPLGAAWSLRFDAFAQHTPHLLPYAERFKIGGDRLGRGFEVAEIAGDQGVGAKIEGRRSLARAPALLGRASVYGFYDIGAAFKENAPGRESAATAGIGVATRTQRAVGTLELAKPLTHADVEGRRDLSLFFELVVTF